MELLPEHGKCFVCGTKNPHGIGIRWYLRDDGTVYGQITLTEAQQGPPGHAHGGASAALLDEAMGLTAWYAGYRVLSVELNVEYLHPVPLGTPVTVTGRMAGKKGRAIHARGEIRLPDGTLAVEGRGVFVDAPKLLKLMGLDE